MNLPKLPSSTKFVDSSITVYKVNGEELHPPVRMRVSEYNRLKNPPKCARCNALCKGDLCESCQAELAGEQL